MKTLRFIFTTIATAAVFACGADAPNVVAANIPTPIAVDDESVAATVHGEDASASDVPDASAGYSSAVKSGNLAPIGTAARAMAVYLNAMHNRIHPIFTDEFLMNLSQQPLSDPMNDMRLVVEVEIVVAPDGSIAKIGIVKSSGIQEFDFRTLDTVLRAAPFGPTPKIAQSPDGFFYMHWAFHRDPLLGCSTANVRPFMLKH